MRSLGLGWYIFFCFLMGSGVIGNIADSGSVIQGSIFCFLVRYGWFMDLLELVVTRLGCDWVV